MATKDAELTHYDTGAFRNTLAAQIKGLSSGAVLRKPAPSSGNNRNDGNSARQSQQPQTGSTSGAGTHPTQPKSKFTMLKAPSFSPAETLINLGQLLDNAREWVNGHVERMVVLWDGMANVNDHTSTGYWMLNDKANENTAEFIPWLEGKVDGGLNLSPEERYMVARVAAMHYAAALWSTDGIPEAETMRALWFLLKTYAARFTQSIPQKNKSVSVLPKVWIEFPYAALGEPTIDSRILHESGLWNVIGRVVGTMQRDGNGYEANLQSAKKGETILSVQQFFKDPHECAFILKVRHSYKEGQRKFFWGGALLVKAVGNKDIGFTLRISEVIDDTMVADFMNASRNDAIPLRAEFTSLSSRLRGMLPEGEHFLARLGLPSEAFQGENLNKSEVTLGRREEDESMYKALNHIWRVMKYAIKDELSSASVVPLREPTVSSAAKSQESQKGSSPQNRAADQPKKPASQETAALPMAGKTRAKPPQMPHEEIVKQEAARDAEREEAEDALTLQSVNNRQALSKISQEEFLHPSQPPGCAHVVIRGTFFVNEKRFAGIHCVVSRSNARGKIEINWFPERLAAMFGGGGYNALIISRLIKQARSEYLRSRAYATRAYAKSESSNGEEPVKVPEVAIGDSLAPASVSGEVAENPPETPQALPESDAASDTVPGTDSERKVSVQAKKLAEEHGLVPSAIQSARSDFLGVNDVRDHLNRHTGQ